MTLLNEFHRVVVVVVVVVVVSAREGHNHREAAEQDLTWASNHSKDRLFLAEMFNLVHQKIIILTLNKSFFPLNAHFLIIVCLECRISG